MTRPLKPITKSKLILGFASLTIGGAILLNTESSPIDVGPAGVVKVNQGIVLVLSGTNRTPVIKFKELLTPFRLTVGRYVHDRDIYGDSVVLTSGTEFSPLDIPHGFMMYAVNASETNKWVIENSFRP